MCSVRACVCVRVVNLPRSVLCKNTFYCINTTVSQFHNLHGAQTEQRCSPCRQKIFISSAGDKRLLFRVTHHPVRKQSAVSLVTKRINSLTLFHSSRGKLKCQRCREQRREYMMSTIERRERENRDAFIQPTNQAFQARNLDIINNT